MKRPVLAGMAGLSIMLALAGSALADPQIDTQSSLWESMKSTADRYLGRPYVWGAAGLKSFDCSGFVWRVLFENGIIIKRTTARKLYMSLPKASTQEEQKSGNIVFFNSLKHCGIVRDSGSFYHAETSKGTHLSRFDAYWRRRVSGYRGLPGLGTEG